MELLDRLNEITEIFQIFNKVFIHSSKNYKILMNDRDSQLEYGDKARLWYDKSYIYLISNGKFKVLDYRFSLEFELEDKLVAVDNSSLRYFNKENYILINQVFDKVKRELLTQFVIFSKELTYIEDNFWGYVLSQSHRLNYSEKIISKPTKFSCSDLFGKMVYWHYDCLEGYLAKDNWILRGDYLIFCIYKDGYFAGKFIKVEIKTGRIKWETEVPYTDMIYDEDQGILVSFWAGNNNGNNFQIIDVENETVEIGEPTTAFELANVNTYGQLQFLSGSKLYFADNVHSYGDAIVPVKFGCFDIETKTVDFLQAIPIEYGIQISQIIYNEEQLYIRMTEKNLLIYK